MKLERKEEILKCIVEEFISTAKAVGSETLQEKYNLNCSSATIRNAMSELEKDGLIEKTHTSSGRVPSAKGYQYYLEKIDNSAVTTVDMEFQNRFQQILKDKTKSVEEVLSQSCDILSDMTQMATVFLGPKAYDEYLVSLQLIKISESTAMGIFITDSGHVEKKTFVLNEEKASFSLLQDAVKLLNDRLAGTKIIDLNSKAAAIRPICMQMFGKEGSIVMDAFFETLLSFSKDKTEVHGRKNLLSLPEFSNNQEALLKALETLEDPDLLERKIVHKEDLGDAKVGFTTEGTGEMAVVSRNLGKDHLAVVGPKRMDYKKIISALEYVVYMLSKHFFQKEESTSLVKIPETNETDSDSTSEEKNNA